MDHSIGCDTSSIGEWLLEDHPSGTDAKHVFGRMSKHQWLSGRICSSLGIVLHDFLGGLPAIRPSVFAAGVPGAEYRSG